MRWRTDDRENAGNAPWASAKDTTKKTISCPNHERTTDPGSRGSSPYRLTPTAATQVFGRALATTYPVCLSVMEAAAPSDAATLVPREPNQEADAMI